MKELTGQNNRQRTMPPLARSLATGWLKNRCPVMLLIAGCLMLATSSLIALGDQKIPVESQPANWQEDAELTDLFFLNQQLGWAIGSRGVILRTENGGREWLSLGQAIAEEEQTLSLQQKFQAFQSGVRTSQTGIADGQSSPDRGRYTCRFESIFFLNEKTGWVAGGYNIPALNQSRGVILHTRDGGISWTPLRGVLAGRIKRLAFTDNAHGWAIGEPAYPQHNGIYFTSDGGQTWSSNPASAGQTHIPATGWKEGQATSQGFIGLTPDGELMNIRDQRIEPAKVALPEPTPFNQIYLINEQQGWAVGDRGVVCLTRDGGRSWLPSWDHAWESSSSESDSNFKRLMSQFDLRTITTSPSRIWLAGFPGSMVFSIDRQSGQIFSHSTGVALPINQIQFVDDQTGWMVGALGTILATTDGGQTWQIQRGEHRHIAALTVSLNSAEIPLDALAMLSAEENKIVAVSVLDDSLSARDRQAIERLGGSLALTIPPAARQADPENWELEKLVRIIRALRPLVLICHSEFQIRPETATDSPRSFDPDSLMATAIRMAADRSQFPDQIEFGKLEPWQVDRVAIRSAMGKWNLDPQMMLLQNGCLVEDKTAISRSLSGLSPFHNQRYVYRVESFSSIRQTKETDIFSGLSQFGKTIPQRTRQQGLRGTRASIEMANRKARKLAELSSFELVTTEDISIWHQQIQSWTAALDESLAGTTLLQLAERYLQAGKIELATLAFEAMLARCPGHPFESAVLLWLTQYYSSDEFAWLEKQRGIRHNVGPMNPRQTNHSLENLTARPLNPASQPSNIGQPATRMAVEQKDGETIISWTPVADKIEVPQSNRWTPPVTRDPASQSNDEPSVRTASLMTPLPEDTPQPQLPAAFASSSQLESTDAGPDAAVPRETEIEDLTQELTRLTARRQLASRYLKRLVSLNPDLSRQPDFQQLELHLTRRLGGFPGVEAGLKRAIQTGNRSDGPSIAAQRELLLGGSRPLQRSDSPFIALRTHSPPRLDGDLNDPVWDSVRQQGLIITKPVDHSHSSSTNAAREAEQTLAEDLILMAYDQQFLYLAVKCQKLPNEFYSMPQQSRTRDADLTQRDRIEFGIDVDRDYRTAFRFSVDYRGWCQESLDGVSGWNPTWYIARSEDAASWTLELAIPWQEITPHPPTGEDVWTIQFSRKTRERPNCWQDQPAVTHFPENKASFLSNLVARPAEFELLRFQ